MDDLGVELRLVGIGEKESGVLLELLEEDPVAVILAEIGGRREHDTAIATGQEAP